jgi:hypothetical protein
MFCCLAGQNALDCRNTAPGRNTEHCEVPLQHRPDQHEEETRQVEDARMVEMGLFTSRNNNTGSAILSKLSAINISKEGQNIREKQSALARAPSPLLTKYRRGMLGHLTRPGQGGLKAQREISCTYTTRARQARVSGTSEGNVREYLHGDDGLRGFDWCRGGLCRTAHRCCGTSCSNGGGLGAGGGSEHAVDR